MDQKQDTIMLRYIKSNLGGKALNNPAVTGRDRPKPSLKIPFPTNDLPTDPSGLPPLRDEGTLYALLPHTNPTKRRPTPPQDLPSTTEDIMAMNTGAKMSIKHARMSEGYIELIREVPYADFNIHELEFGAQQPYIAGIECDGDRKMVNVIYQIKVTGFSKLI